MTAGSDTGRLPDLPYPGIEPFNYARRKVFFARDKEARSLMQLIAMYRGVLLYSDSGTGKSSLVNAGLIPLAVDRGLQPEKIRVQPRRGEELIVERLSKSVDDKRPFLPSLFASDEQHERVVISVEEFEKTLRQPELTVRPLLIFDQFEEWITLFEEGAKSKAANEARIAQKSIREAIVSLINDRELRVKVLIALREDYLAKLNPLFEQCPSLPDQYLRLTALSGDQIYRAIRGPFEEHPGRYRVEVGPALAKKIQEQFEQRSEGADVHLTEVQIVCRSLFEAGTSGQELDRYFADQGGVQGILERYLELALESLNIDQREPAVALLTRMLTSAGTRNVISEDDLLNRVENEDRIPHELLGKTLRSLEQEAKLIRRERRRDVYYYEIASEFLVGWIRRKAQERQRLAEQRKSREVEEKRALVYQARSARLFRRLTAALVVIAVIAIVAAVYAYHQVRVAEKAKEQAEVQRIVAEKAKEQAEEQRIVAEKAKEQMEAALQGAEQQRGAALIAVKRAAGPLPDFVNSWAARVQVKLRRPEINSIGMRLVYIPDGLFKMGSGEAAAQLAGEYDLKEADFRREFPQHEVLISKSFWMGQTEVTQGQYKLVMNAEPWSGQKWVEEDANNPAVYVSWDDTVEFCRRLSELDSKGGETYTYRLPTEAEWEYACRAGTTTRFSFGDNGSSLGEYAWFDGNAKKVGQEYAHSVGQKRPNPWGLYDMHGNVWEWCSDRYGETYYSNSPPVDPKGPETGAFRSFRGGSWTNVVSFLRCSSRVVGRSPDDRLYNQGFRVVRQPPTYSLIVTAVGGSVTKSPDKGGYDPGETVTLTAIPNKGYKFANWSGGLDHTANPVTITMDSDKSVTASFTWSWLDDIQVTIGKGTDRNPKLEAEGWKQIGPDLNRDAGGNYLYLWVRGPGKDNILVTIGKGTDRNPKLEAEGWKQIGPDLNRGAGGNYLYLWVRGPGKDKVLVTIGKGTNRNTTMESEGWRQIGPDLNRDASGNYLYLWVR